MWCDVGNILSIVQFTLQETRPSFNRFFGWQFLVEYLPQVQRQVGKDAKSENFRPVKDLRRTVAPVNQ